METYACLLKYSSIELYTQGNQPQEALSFQSSVVNHLVVKDRDALEKNISEFLVRTHIQKGSIVLLLSDSVVFQKEISVDKNFDESRELSTFIESLPLERGDAIARIHVHDEHATLYATSRSYVDGVVGAFLRSNIQTLSILPAILFDFRNDNMYFSNEMCAKALSTWNSYKELNFLSRKKFSWTVIYGMSMAIMIGYILFVLYKTFIISR